MSGAVARLTAGTIAAAVAYAATVHGAAFESGISSGCIEVRVAAVAAADAPGNAFEQAAAG